MKKRITNASGDHIIIPPDGTVEIEAEIERERVLASRREIITVLSTDKEDYDHEGLKTKMRSGGEIAEMMSMWIADAVKPPSDGQKPRYLVDENRSPEFNYLSETGRIIKWDHRDKDMEISIWCGPKDDIGTFFGVQIDTDDGMYQSLGANTLAEAVGMVQAIMWTLQL